MEKFIDNVYFTVRSGKGGDGAISFERYKYKRIGKPDGGQGGKGGDVILRVNPNYSELSHLIHKNLIKAGNGTNGAGSNKTGSDGADVIIDVPPGTIVKNFETNEVITELLRYNDRYVLLKGGKGGKGNSAFKSATNRSPRRFETGKPGKEMKIRLELKLLADIGLVGYPNAGKSTLLKAITSANPKISDYPFTTLTPNIGIFYDRVNNPYSIADIPGLIEGAASGKGLGFRFLKHIERTKLIAIVVDLSDKYYLNKIKLLLEEMKKYNPMLIKKHIIVVGNKIDLIQNIDSIKFKGIKYKYILTSALKASNIEKVKEFFIKELTQDID